MVFLNNQNKVCHLQQRVAKTLIFNVNYSIKKHLHSDNKYSNNNTFKPCRGI